MSNCTPWYEVAYKFLKRHGNRWYTATELHSIIGCDMTCPSFCHQLTRSLNRGFLAGVKSCRGVGYCFVSESNVTPFSKETITEPQFEITPFHMLAREADELKKAWQNKVKEIRNHPEFTEIISLAP